MGKENKSNRIYLDISHKRHRSRSRMSDAEQEVDDILRQIAREEVLQKNAINDSFLCDQWEYNDAETRYFEMLSLMKHRSEEECNFVGNNDDNNDDNDGSPSGGAASGRSSEDRESGFGASLQSQRTYQTEFHEPPSHGCWSDESTYLKLAPKSDPTLTLTESNQIELTPSDTKNSYTTTHKQNKTLTTKTRIVTQTTEIGNSSDKETNLTMTYQMTDRSSDCNNDVTVRNQALDVPVAVLGSVGSSGAGNIDVHNIPPSQHSDIQQKVVSGVAEVQKKMSDFESRISVLMDHQVVDQWLSLQTLLSELSSSESEVQHLSAMLATLPQDSETLNMKTILGGVITRLNVLMHELHGKKQAIEGGVRKEDQQKLHLMGYQRLLQDLECWVTHTYTHITAEVTLGSVDAIREHISLNQSLQRDFARRETELEELRGKCSQVSGDGHIQDLALEMTQHLSFLSQTMCDTRQVLQGRLRQLQVRLCHHNPTCPYTT